MNKIPHTDFRRLYELPDVEATGLDTNELVWEVGVTVLQQLRKGLSVTFKVVDGGVQWEADG